MRMSYIIIILYIFGISHVSASIVATTSGQYDDNSNMTANSNSIYTQIMIIIPKEALNSTHDITALRFPCIKDYYSPPNQNLAFRFYKYYGGSVFSMIDSSYITPAQCVDYMYTITWNLYSVEEVDHNYDYALGVYSVGVTSGFWSFPYLSEYVNISNPTAYSWLNVTNNNPIINVSIVDAGGNPYYDNGSKLLNYPYFKILGIKESSVPTPTPTPPPYVAPNGSSGIDEALIGENNTYNGSINGTYSTIPNGTGFDTLLLDDGLCVSGTCHVSDMVDFLNTHIYDFWILSFALVLIRFWGG